MIEIVLVDDESKVRQGLKMRLELTKEMHVVGEAGDADTALSLIRALQPEVVVMDVELSDQDGIVLTKTLRDENCRSAFVILTLHDDADTRKRARTAGAVNFVSKHEGGAALIRAIREAVSRPMRDFYERYYTAVEHSRAHATFCEYAYGKNLAQHGFATMEQLVQVIEVVGLNASSRTLDLGCGNGMIAEYLSDATGAHITGLDYSATAIERAQNRTQAKRHQLEFIVGDLTQPNLPPDSFDTVLALDTIYFSKDFVDTLRHWHTLLKSEGKMAILYSHGANPENPKETFRHETLPFDKTPLADALTKCGLAFQTWDITPQDYELAQRKKQILEKLCVEFQAECNSFLYDNRIGETLGVLDAIESGMHARYLYVVQV